ncbi:MAG: L-aspartate oxidase [Bacteroidota bacterium]|nr:L-aspartate oxidase [Bacteroidota bacterium]
MRKEVDFLIIGSGIAGLSFALKVAPYGKVCIVTKAGPEESSTNLAQGGIASAIYDPDSYEKHIQDTLNCGDGLCDEKTVRLVVSESHQRIKELISWGTEFDKTDKGLFDLAREGGHSEYRVLHHKDKTGAEIERALLAQVRKEKNIEILEYNFAIEIITQHHLGIDVRRTTPDIECYGAYVMDMKTGMIKTILSKVTLMATGGTGRVYSTTTNPNIATGDGIAMVYRAKGKIENVEFVQFHPTSLYNLHEKPSFLISEAVRGHGGILKTIDGKEFMQKYDPRKSLAPRDITARAIDKEMKISGDDYVYLDCRHIGKDELMDKFPTIYNKCLSIGIDISKEMIPVVPCAHYMCGGIKADEYARSTIKHLYAVGECACTGLHGANRLASNSLLEAVVFSHRASIDAIEAIQNINFCHEVPDWNDEGTSSPEEMVLITQSMKEVESIMSVYVGIVRSNLRLKRALDRLEIIYRETEDLFIRSTLSPQLCELRNVINVAYLIIKMAIDRKESRGLHYNIDFPSKSDNLINTIK